MAISKIFEPKHRNGKLKLGRFNSKGQSEYAWIFSLIIGAVIILLAIYAAGKYVKTGTYQSQAELVREFDVLLNPFTSMTSQTSMSLSKEVTMPADVQLNFSCNSLENYDQLTLKTKKGKTYEEGVGYKMHNKYVFSETVQGKSFLIFSKPLELPWRIDDMVYIIGADYCFIGDIPQNIKEEIQDLGSPRLSLECEKGDKRVCFNTAGCDIKVDYARKSVTKNGKILVFAGDSLMYAAVFSEPALYNCNIDRLMKRLSVQASINLEKAKILGKEGCDTAHIQSTLMSLKASADGRMLVNIQDLAPKALQNNPPECPVF